jgi:uncharacterized protein YoxC
MRKGLIAATIGEVLLLVAVLAGYLIAIAETLRRVSATLGKITFGVRAIETQTQPLGPRVTEVNETLEQVAGRLAQAAPAAGTKPRRARQSSSD